MAEMEEGAPYWFWTFVCLGFVLLWGKGQWLSNLERNNRRPARFLRRPFSGWLTRTKLKLILDRKFTTSNLAPSPPVVLDELVKLHPPRGCLMHGQNVGLVVSSQEQVLFQERYTYHVGRIINPEQNQDVNPSSLDVVFKLSEMKKKKSQVIGTAVVCSPNGVILTTDHYLKDLSKRAHLTVGGLKAKILARDNERDIAALQFCQPTRNHNFIGLDGTTPIVKEMKVQMLSFPSMADEEFNNIGASITHGRVVNIWTPNLVGADYVAFRLCCLQ